MLTKVGKGRGVVKKEFKCKTKEDRLSAYEYEDGTVYLQVGYVRGKIETWTGIGLSKLQRKKLAKFLGGKDGK